MISEKIAVRANSLKKGGSFEPPPNYPEDGHAPPSSVAASRGQPCGNAEFNLGPPCIEIQA